MLELKLQNGNKVKYILQENNQIDMCIIIQKILTLSENLYHENIDTVSASYELDAILDNLIILED